MAECIILKGGGGADLDMVTAGSSDVLAGKVIVDKNGEPLTGTMLHLTNKSGITHATGNSTKIILGDAAYISKNTDGVTRAEIRYNGDAGYISGNTLFGIEQEKMAAAGGLTADKMLANKQAFGIVGSIPLQNAEIAGTDQMWAQNYSNWGDGNYFLGVKDGYYLNGVNWVRGYNANFVASNIKKGINVAGVVGTFEGYVPTASDLYLRGNNIAGFVSRIPSAANLLFESGQITMGTTNATTADTNYVYAQKNLTGYNYINVECYCNTGYNTGPALGISVGSSITSSALTSPEAMVIGTVGVGYKTVTLNISAINATMYIKVFVVDRTSAYVYRIWLS